MEYVIENYKEVVKEYIRQSRERSVDGEEKSTCGHLYPHHPVDNAFLQRTNDSKNISRSVLGNRDGVLEQHHTEHPAVHPIGFPDWRKTGNYRRGVALYWN